MALDSTQIQADRLTARYDDVVAQAEMYRVLVENAVDVIVRTDAGRRRMFVSPSARDVLGYEPYELIGGTLYQTVHPDDLGVVEARFGRIGPDHPSEDMTFRVRRKDGEYIWIEARYRYLPLDGGILGLLRDVTARKIVEAQLAEANEHLATANRALQRLANHDGLTGLCNRRYFDELLDEEFRRARRHKVPLGLALVDVDFFKLFNDAYGHVAGDECLRQVSRAVSGALRRPGDHAARYGGEEIVALLPATDEYGAMMVAERMRAAVASLGIIHGGSAYGIVTISGGVSMLLPARDASVPTDLIDAADRALYQAKTAGRNRIYSCSERPT